MTMGKAIRLAAALGMALVLAACSSSNGVKKERDEALDDVATLQTQLTQAQNDLAAAQQKATDDLAAKQRELDQANTALSTAQADLATANTALSTAQTALDQANMDLNTTDAALEKANMDLSEAQADLATANTNLGTAEADVIRLTGELATATGQVETVNTAIMEMETALRDVGVEGDDLEALVAKVVADLEAEMDAMDKADREKNIADVTKAYGSLSQMLVSSPAATTDILQQAATVPKDAMGGDTQGAPKTQPWGFTYDEAISLDVASDGQEERTRGRVNKFRATSTITVITEDNSQKHSLSGTFDGVPGTLSCTGTGCNLPLDDEGKIVSGKNGAWVFKPTGGVNADHEVKDMDYVSFSYWTDDMGVRVSYMLEGTGMTRRMSLPSPATPRTVTYSGSAGGMYVQRDNTGAGTTGNFTADAMLTTTLQAADSANNIPGPVVSGEISKFMDGDKAPLGDMSVKLNGNTVKDASGVFSGKTSSTNDALGLGMGDWQASFYGGQGHSESAAGAFNFYWGLGAVAGGFAVEEDD